MIGPKMIDMRAKDVRNFIFSVIVLIIGIRAVYYIFNGYLAKVEILKSMRDLLASVSSLVDLFTYILIAVVILSIPFYLSKRSDEKKVSKNAVPNRPGSK
jgi:hypothetical protein